MPPTQLLLEQVCHLRIGVEQHLKSKSRLPVTINFRGDIYKYLFRGKGMHTCGWKYLKRTDFPIQYFPEGWDICADSHGQGTKPFYPMKLRAFISWSPKKNCLGKGRDNIILLPLEHFKKN